MKAALRFLPFLWLFALASLPVHALEVGDSAPCINLDGVDTAGEKTTGCIRETVDSHHDFTILEFFSIYCGPCVSNIPTLSGLASSVALNTTFRAVAIDRDTAAVKRFLQEPNSKQYINYPVALDGKREAMKAFHIQYTPTLFVLDKKYNIVYKHIGSLNAAEVETIKKIVAGGESN